MNVTKLIFDVRNPLLKWFSKQARPNKSQKTNGKQLERITVTCHTTGNGFTIPFPNGSIDVPDQKGGYAIASGCGSGKTESIKSLIRQKWDKGILYCVDTIAECVKMYSWVKENLVGVKLNGQTLTEDDIFMLHSGVDFSEIQRYKNNPDLIVNCRILIITHVRFLTDLINLFVTYEPNNTSPNIPSFDGDFGKLMIQNNLREYLIFDETPLFLKPFISIPKEILGIFSIGNNGGYQCKSLPDMKEYYQRFIKGSILDYCKGDTKLDQKKREVVLNLISRYYHQWITEKDKKKYDIHFYPADLIVPNMNTHVLIYEGVGDVLFKNARDFKLLDIPKKYNVSVQFNKFSFGLIRKNTPETQPESDFIFKVKTICDSLAGKTLIVVWKNFNDADDLNDETNKSEWRDRVKSELKRMGLNESDFSVTYYGARDTKSTNEYRDYQNIILCGNWDLPNSVSSRFNKAYHSVISQDDYKFWYFVQLISRIGIRNNNGNNFKVYYSGDYKDDLMKALEVYFNQNILNIPSRKKAVPVWQSEVEKHGKMYVPNIGKLIVYNPDLEKAIISHDSTFRLDITLDEIYRRLGKTTRKKEKKPFKPLIIFLAKYFGITLNIITKKKP